jgi:hypothetical protein
MAKRKHKRETEQRFARIAQTAALSAASLEQPEDRRISNHHDAPLTDDEISSSAALSTLAFSSDSHELTKMKKFRFQLLHQWIATRIAPCRVADVGGGKGLLAYLLQESGWAATVIDPIAQGLPAKYKDLDSNRQVRVAETEAVPRLNREFEPGMVGDFDLLVAMHAHGCNIQMIDAASALGREVILLPCCVIHEPILPPPGVHWIQWLAEYVIGKGFAVEPFRLNFKGQNIGIYARQPVR